MPVSITYGVRRKKRLLYALIILFLVIFSFLSVLEAISSENTYSGLEPIKSSKRWQNEPHTVLQGSGGTSRIVTAYTLGREAETDSDPCVGAANVDLCEMVAFGTRVCAANFVPLWSVLEVEGYGKCIVLDRLNKKHPQRVDIAMLDYQDAVQWGVKKLNVYDHTRVPKTNH